MLQDWKEIHVNHDQVPILHCQLTTPELGGKGQSQNFLALWYWQQKSSVEMVGPFITDDNVHLVVFMPPFVTIWSRASVVMAQCMTLSAWAHAPSPFTSKTLLLPIPVPSHSATLV